MSDLPAGTRILLIEDEPIIAMTAEDMIEELGGAVSGKAANVEDALRLAEEGNFDVALLDMNLNGVMSTPVARLLTERGHRFAFTTGYGVQNDPDIPAPVVMKPYTLSMLGQVVNGLLAR